MCVDERPVLNEPLVDPNYLSTEVDRYVYRESMRQQTALLGSNATRISTEIVDNEFPPASFDVSMSVTSTDEYLFSTIPERVLESNTMEPPTPGGKAWSPSLDDEFRSMPAVAGSKI